MIDRGGAITEWIGRHADAIIVLILVLWAVAIVAIGSFGGSR